MSHKHVFFCRFEFLQACSGKLAELNLPPGHTWSGEKVQRLAGQGHFISGLPTPSLHNHLRYVLQIRVCLLILLLVFYK